MKRWGTAILIAFLIVGVWALLDYLFGRKEDLILVFSAAMIGAYLNGDDETPEKA